MPQLQAFAQPSISDVPSHRYRIDWRKRQHQPTTIKPERTAPQNRRSRTARHLHSACGRVERSLLQTPNRKKVPATLRVVLQRLHRFATEGFTTILAYFCCIRGFILLNKKLWASILESVYPQVEKKRECLLCVEIPQFDRQFLDHYPYLYQPA